MLLSQTPIVVFAGKQSSTFSIPKISNTTGPFSVIYSEITNGQLVDTNDLSGENIRRCGNRCYGPFELKEVPNLFFVSTNNKTPSGKITVTHTQTGESVTQNLAFDFTQAILRIEPKPLTLKQGERFAFRAHELVNSTGNIEPKTLTIDTNRGQIRIINEKGEQVSNELRFNDNNIYYLETTIDGQIDPIRISALSSVGKFPSSELSETQLSIEHHLLPAPVVTANLDALQQGTLTITEEMLNITHESLPKNSYGVLNISCSDGAHFRPDPLTQQTIDQGQARLHLSTLQASCHGTLFVNSSRLLPRGEFNASVSALAPPNDDDNGVSATRIGLFSVAALLVCGAGVLVNYLSGKRRKPPRLPSSSSGEIQSSGQELFASHQNSGH